MSNTDMAINAIRKIETLTCDDLLDLFNVIASKMVDAGFSELDIQMVDEANGFICGEKA